MQISQPDYSWKMGYNNEKKWVIRPILVLKSQIRLNYDAIQINFDFW